MELRDLTYQLWPADAAYTTGLKLAECDGWRAPGGGNTGMPNFACRDWRLLCGTATIGLTSCWKFARSLPALGSRLRDDFAPRKPTT